MTLSLATLLVAAWLEWVPWLGAASVALLLPLALFTFRRPPAPAKVVGWTQLVLGLLVAVATAAGVRTGW
jgi:phosphoglycerol transferase MdoB-like AlkP superfamily enzyme